MRLGALAVASWNVGVLAEAPYLTHMQVPATASGWALRRPGLAPRQVGAVGEPSRVVGVLRGP